MTKRVSAGPGTHEAGVANAGEPQPAAQLGKADPTVAHSGQSHCPFHRTVDLLQRLAPGKMRVGFLLGAGCPQAVRVKRGDKTVPLIPDIVGLTNDVKALLDGDNELVSVAASAWERVASRGIKQLTVEDVLSHIRSLDSLSGPNGIDGFPRASLAGLDRRICEHIKTITSQKLSALDTPYHKLASWIQAIPRDKPVEVFTTNYDLLLEQAFEEHCVPFFDGFIGSNDAFFDHESMNAEDLPARWARLWKIHGSINWWMTPQQRIRRSRDIREGEQLLIYPSHLKYDQSRAMPFLAMLERLSSFLRTHQCVLITCGYSFGDQHVNAAIEQGLANNPNAACFGMLFKDRAEAPNALTLARRRANLSILAADGAVIGTVERDWHDEVRDNNPAFPIAVVKNMPTTRTNAPPERCKWALGDFATLGAFLGHQLASRNIEQEAPK